MYKRYFTCRWGRYAIQRSLLVVVDQLICISDIYLSTDKYKRHSRAICYFGGQVKDVASKCLLMGTFYCILPPGTHRLGHVMPGYWTSLEIVWMTPTWISKLKLFVLFNRLPTLTWDARVKAWCLVSNWVGGNIYCSWISFCPSCRVHHTRRLAQRRYQFWVCIHLFAG